MKILMVAVFTPTSTNVAQAVAFEHNGAEVVRYDYRDAGRSYGKHVRDADIVELCKTIKPDMVFFSKCSFADKGSNNDIPTWVMQECNKHSKTVLWYMDAMDNFTTSLVEKIQNVNYVFCALETPYSHARRWNAQSFFLQEGYDPDVNIKIDNVPYKHDLSFIGNLKGSRKSYHDIVKFFVYTDAFGPQHSLAVAETKINLNFTIDGAGTSDRTYKILASGGFLLTQPWYNMERDFKIGADLAVFESVDDLKKQAMYYLIHERERMAIAEHGYNTVQQFSTTQWAKTILEKVRQ